MVSGVALIIDSYFDKCDVLKGNEYNGVVRVDVFFII